MGFFDFLFGSNAPEPTKPDGCCGGGCCGHNRFDVQSGLALTDDDLSVFGALDDRVVVGKVLELRAHQDPKITKVRVSQVDLGNGAIEQILCGAPNLEVGQIGPVATVGTKLSPDFEITVRDIRGEESHGMICARRELGLSDEDDSGIWVLPEVCESFLGRSLRGLG